LTDQGCLWSESQSIGFWILQVRLADILVSRNLFNILSHITSYLDRVVPWKWYCYYSNIWF